WCVYARAGQSSRRPYVPSPSQVRPLSQAPAARPPAVPPAVGQTAPTNSGTKPDDMPHKQALLTGKHGTYDGKAQVTNARDFVYTEDDMTVTGVKARYSDKTRVLEAEGNLVLDDPKHHTTGEKARYDNRADVKLAVITGKV